MRFFLVLISSVVTLLLSGCAGSSVRVKNEVKQLKWIVPPDRGQSELQFAKSFAKRVLEMSNGSIKVEVVVGDTRIPKRRTTRLVKLVQLGRFDFSQVSSNHLASIGHRFILFDLPFLFSDADHLHKVLNSFKFDELFDELEQRHLVGLKITYGGQFRKIGLVNKSVETYRDFKGLLIGTEYGSVFKEFWEDIGGLSFDKPLQVRLRYLARRLSDGIEFVYSERNQAKSVLPFRQVIELNHIPLVRVVIANAQSWSKLSLSEQKIVRRSLEIGLKEQSVFDRQEIKKVRASYLQQKVVKSLAYEDRTQLRIMTRPIYKRYYDLIPESLVRRIEQIE